MKLRLRCSALAALAIAAGACAAHAQETTIRIGLVKSISNVANLWAIEKGYFREVGIKLVVEELDTSANVLALLAQNQLQMIEGGISAGYFNGLEKNLPVTMVMDRVSSPLGHNLMLRPDLKGQITRLSQLKGKVIATNGQGAVSTYEVGKMLETDGLTIADVDVKVLPFPQMAIASRTRRSTPPSSFRRSPRPSSTGGDGAAFIDPDDLVKPHPLTIAVSMINTDWAKANDKVVRNYYYGLPARRARLLQRLSRRQGPRRDDRPAGQDRHRNAARRSSTSIRGRRAIRTAASTPTACSTCRRGTPRTR